MMSVWLVSKGEMLKYELRPTERFTNSQHWDGSHTRPPVLYIDAKSEDDARTLASITLGCPREVKPHNTETPICPWGCPDHTACKVIELKDVHTAAPTISEETAKNSKGLFDEYSIDLVADYYRTDRRYNW